MKRFVRVWRVAALVFLGLTVITAMYFWISGAPHHAALKRFYSYIGILSVVPPPKFFMLNFIFLLVELPFLIGIGDGKEVFPTRSKIPSAVPAETAPAEKADATGEPTQAHECAEKAASETQEAAAKTPAAQDGQNPAQV